MLCQRNFTSRKVLVTHVKQIHNNTGPSPYKCNMCDKASKHNIASLRSHIKVIHMGEKNHKCKDCGQAFGKNSNLKSHISSIHKGEKNYKCTTCDKAFTQSSNLKNHIKTVHMGEKNHECAICDQAFLEKGILNKHTKSHKWLSFLLCLAC